MDIIDLQRNQIIYNENSKVDYLYFILRGEFEVSSSNYNHVGLKINSFIMNSRKNLL